MKKPGFLAASLGTACLFAFGAAAVAHYALTPGGAEVIEVANAAEVRPAEAPRETASARSASAPSALSIEGAGRAASRPAGDAADSDKSSVSRVSARALQRKSVAALNGDDDDDDDDDD